MRLTAPRTTGACALRGGVVGLAVCLVLYLSYVYTKTDLAVLMRARFESEWDGTVMIASALTGVIRLGLPISYVVGTLLAWMLGLRHPWLLPLVGLLAAAVVLCAWVSFTTPYLPRLVGSIVLVAFFAGSAVVTSRRPTEVPRSA